MSTCPECGSWKTKTLATRRDTRYNWIWRRKECKTCEYKFQTYEIAVESLTMPDPINPHGRIEE